MSATIIRLIDDPKNFAQTFRETVEVENIEEIRSSSKGLLVILRDGRELVCAGDKIKF